MLWKTCLWLVAIRSVLSFPCGAPPKICINCKHLNIDSVGILPLDGETLKQATCRLNVETDLVSGKTREVPASLCRRDESRCGKEGKFFEPYHKSNYTQKN